MFSIPIARLAGATRWLPIPATHLLGWSWVASAAAYALTRVGVFLRCEATAEIDKSGNNDVEYASLKIVSAWRELIDSIARLERRSVALPLIGLAFVLPLTLHVIVFLVLSRYPIRLPWAPNFEGHIVWSVIVVGHCHLLAAERSWRFAFRLSVPTDSRAFHRLRWMGFSSWAWVVALSMIPGLLFGGIPVFVVGITGVYLPLSFAWMMRKMARERWHSDPDATGIRPGI